MHTESVVVSIGGSILVPGENDSDYITRLAAMLKEASKESRIAVICGGGRPPDTTPASPRSSAAGITSRTSSESRPPA